MPLSISMVVYLCGCF